MKALGICYNPHYPYIDHIAPLCSILEIPLLCSDANVEQTIKSYYPEIKLIYEPDIQNKWKGVLDQYEVLVYADFYRRYHGAFEFLDFVYSRQMCSIYCPHGNSDKGQRSFWMERFADEDITLIYGQKMIDFLKSKGVWERIKRPIIIGNYRDQYYKRHRNFFEKTLESELFPKWRKKEQKKNLLYIPTWQTKRIMGQDEWDSSSFFEAHPFLFENLPEDCRLFVKLHPNLYVFYPDEIEAIKDKYNDKDVIFIENCPVIYPLLDLMDVYIGDLSSVGYDFLTFNKPMFFLNSEKRDSAQDAGLFLYRCGIEIVPEQFRKIYSTILSHVDTADLKKMRQEVYEYTFGEAICLDKLKETLSNVC